MNFLRKRIFVAYGLLLVMLGGFPGAWIGRKLFPERRAGESIDTGVLAQSSTPIAIATLALLCFVIYLHTRQAEQMILQERRRNWLIFTYGAYLIGIVLGGFLSSIQR